jgi:argininosuccinate lyase
LVQPLGNNARMNQTSAKPWEHAKSGEGSASDPLAMRFVESLSYDTRLYEADIRGSLAHAAMLREVGLISEKDLQEIRRGLAEIKAEIEGSAAGPHAVNVPGAWPGWKTEYEDVHMCVEAALIAKVGDAGRKLHTGRSRNDQVALDLRLWLRDAAALTARHVDDVLESLESLAQRQGDIVMPSYTHVQRAQPVCAGGELMAWHAMLGRDLDDLNRLATPGESPLGSGAVAGSSLPLDRELTATSLGFARPSVSSIDATASRDEALDFLYVLSRTSMHLSRWAEQWIMYASTEFSFVKIDERYTTGSSMMPQKRNPDMLELIRGRCGSIYGSFAALMTICKGLPIAYNRDLQEDKRHVFAAFDATLDCLAMAARIVESARFNAEHITRGLDRGHLDATSLAEYLVTVGVPFRTAHQVVGSLVRKCDASGRNALAQLSLEEIRTAVKDHGQPPAKVTSDVQQWLGAANVVKQYKSFGNAGHDGYRVALERAVAARQAAKAANDPIAPEPPPAAPVAPAPDVSLFGTKLPGAAADQKLIEVYEQVGRTLDDLPYTAEFDRIYRAVDGETIGLSRHDVLHRLHNLRKAGRLPKAGRGSTSPPRIEAKEEGSLRELVVEAAGSLGQRDQLPYTTKFDELVEQFNAGTGRSLDPHDIWRLVAKLAK